MPSSEISPIAMLMLSETYDCGLFAFAAALVLGQNPGHFLFYQVEYISQKLESTSLLAQMIDMLQAVVPCRALH